MTSVTVVVPMTIRRRGGRKQIIGPDGVPLQVGGDGVEETRGDPVLVKALARAFRWRRLLEEGRYGSIRELANAEGVDRNYVGRLLNLTLLAPEVVEAVLHGDCNSVFKARDAQVILRPRGSGDASNLKPHVSWRERAPD